MAEEQAGKKPELTFTEMEPGREFRPLIYVVTEQLVRDYIETVGDDNPLYHRSLDGSSPGMAPPGLAAIYARLSYLQDHVMPPGGVLAKQEITFKKSVRIGETLEVRARVADRTVDSKERKWVTFHIQAFNERGEEVSEIRLYAIKPK